MLTYRNEKEVGLLDLEASTGNISNKNSWVIFEIIIIIIMIMIMGTGVGQVGALAYYGNMDAPTHQNPGRHLWQVPVTQRATHVRVTTTSFDERMSNIEFHLNDVNETRAFSEGVASGRCPVDQQHRPGRHPATAEQ